MIRHVPERPDQVVQIIFQYLRLDAQSLGQFMEGGRLLMQHIDQVLSKHE